MEMKETRLLNLQLKEELDYLFAELTRCMTYLPHYWYNLKNFTHNLHTVYRLLNKFLQIYGQGSTSQKCEYHNLIYGPRPIVQDRNL